MVINASSSVIDQAEIVAQSLIADGDVTVPPAPPTADSSITYWAKTLGECYTHGLGVARILNRWQADDALQAAGLLHSLVWHNALGIEQVENACGERVAFLLREYCRILKYPVPASARGRPEAIRRVKLYVATHRDPALAFLGVASLWEHFTVAQGKKSSINRGFLNEAQNVLIPMLDVLGMWDLKQKVEKWVVQHGPNWQFYQQLMDSIKQNEDTRRQAFETIAETLRQRFPTAQIGPKPFIPRTIYNPAYVDQLPTIEALQHKLKIDVLVDDEESCYVILGYIHRLWPPPDGSRITDYIGNGKLNGYRCLQTKVNFALGAGYLHVYFHIRTWEMDEINRWGLAALELRKQDSPSRTKKTWWETRKDAYPKIHSAEIGSLPDTLHVFSPQGELFSFARGSTVVDYAYQVHSGVAHQCKRFRVNGEVVNPTTVLRHLDLVELERDPQFSGPTEAWLNAARTERARNSIRRFLKQRKQLPHRGRTILNQRLRALEEYYRIDIPNHRVEQALG
ncbi:MAG: TGS domain-containing protein, partial [Anaerolineae bacterium]|nr:TGS domain-containing protein [Anaerolineae bacterium]